ncbi:hypothetical protein CALVIDRAFT_524994 [Calocera viscosa TUFC12733]|uniref:Uncharacterized protein n=1 Tax=Calocera viscosa (strain TUFC12733) TaxID=1330018 RepID=A0A167QMU9_CALVF|nr:hypothetical protein CALVIDRAFT_524994 [Calocera viscosa TUFC12733]
MCRPDKRNTFKLRLHKLDILKRLKPLLNKRDFASLSKGQLNMEDTMKHLKLLLNNVHIMEHLKPPLNKLDKLSTKMSSVPILSAQPFLKLRKALVPSRPIGGEYSAIRKQLLTSSEAQRQEAQQARAREEEKARLFTVVVFTETGPRTFGGLLALQDNTGLTTRISEWKDPIKKWLTERLGPDFDSLEMYNAEAQRWEDYARDTIRSVRSGERILCRCGQVPDNDELLQDEIIQLSRRTEGRDVRRGNRTWTAQWDSPSRKGSISPTKEKNSRGLKEKESKSKELNAKELKPNESNAKELKKNQKKRRANSRGSESSDLLFEDVDSAGVGAQDNAAQNQSPVIVVSSDSEGGSVKVQCPPKRKSNVRTSVWPGTRTFKQVRDTYYAVERLKSDEGLTQEVAVRRVTYLEVPKATWHENCDRAFNPIDRKRWLNKLKYLKRWLNKLKYLKRLLNKLKYLKRLLNNLKCLKRLLNKLKYLKPRLNKLKLFKLLRDKGDIQ